MDYGIQMYSLRDVTQKDLKGSLAAVADMGYKLVEFAGFFGHSAADVRGWLDEYGLTVSGTHTGREELADDVFDATVAYHKAIGNRCIIIPGADLTTAAKLDAFIDFVNRVQPKLAAEGIRLGYHNHSHEFLPNEDGLIIHTELEKRTSLLFEIDTYWAYNAGLDPVALLERLADRIPVIHLKDGVSARSGRYEDQEGKPLGMGTAPVAAVRRAAIRLGMDMVVESESLTPDGPTEAKICIDYLKQLDRADG